MAGAWIDGRPVAVADAAVEAATLLAHSRLPLITGLGTDIAGARAAIALANRVGGVVDHLGSAAVLRDLSVARESGMLVTTPNEAALRADLLLLVGRGLVDAWPALPTRLLGRSPDRNLVAGERRIIRLCPGVKPENLGLDGGAVETIGRDAAQLPGILASLRARIGKRPCRQTSIPRKSLDALAATLAAARFGVAVWSSVALDALAIEMLCGIANDLNAATRFSGLPLADPDGAVGVLQTCGWMTGFPMRTSFGRGVPDHDPWRFDADRLVESGESDCVLWISAYRPVAPAWERDVPTIALCPGDAVFRHPPRVRIAVGRPGVDYDSIERLAATGTIGRVAATRRSGAVSVADAIGTIASAIEDRRSNDGVLPC